MFLQELYPMWYNGCFYSLLNEAANSEGSEGCWFQKINHLPLDLGTKLK